MDNYYETKGCHSLLQDYNDHCEKYGRPKANPLEINFDDPQLYSSVLKLFDEEDSKIDPEITFYNPTRLIKTNQKKRIALRSETKKSEKDSHVVFLEKKEDKWEILENYPHLHLQDPFHIENVQGFHIFGGVEVSEKNGGLSYRTLFYRYKDDINDLELFARGPEGMKDIRLIELKNGKIGVFTRPQGKSCGLGKIAYIRLDSLDNLIEDNILRAEIIPGQFQENEWGGVNDLYLLENGHVGVLGHIAHFECVDGKWLKNYYSMVFVFDPDTKKASPLRIIATADEIDFDVERKFDALGSVLFSGGLEISGDRAKLYAGVNDTQAVCFDLANPFSLHLASK